MKSRPSRLKLTIITDILKQLITQKTSLKMAAIRSEHHISTKPLFIKATLTSSFICSVASKALFSVVNPAKGDKMYFNRKSYRRTKKTQHNIIKARTGLPNFVFAWIFHIEIAFFFVLFLFISPFSIFSKIPVFMQNLGRRIFHVTLC